MTTYVRCAELFTGAEDGERKSQTLAIDDAGRLTYVGATDAAPIPGRGDSVLDYGKLFVMPGLIDVHTHLAYGNAKSEEDIDLYHPMEFRALRGLFFAQKVVAAGYTSICAPGDAGQISLSIRNAIDFRAVRRAAGHRRRPLHHDAPGADRLVSDLDRRARHLDRPAGHQQGRGDRGDPGPGQERRRLHQARAGRHPAPPRRLTDRRVHPGRDLDHGRRNASARPQASWCTRVAARRCCTPPVPASI